MSCHVLRLQSSPSQFALSYGNWEMRRIATSEKGKLQTHGFCIKRHFANFAKGVKVSSFFKIATTPLNLPLLFSRKFKKNICLQYWWPVITLMLREWKFCTMQLPTCNDPFFQFCILHLFAGELLKEKSVIIKDNSDFSNHVINVNCTCVNANN